MLPQEQCNFSLKRGKSKILKKLPAKMWLPWLRQI